MKILKYYIFLLLFLTQADDLTAQKKLSVELFTGLPYNIPLPLNISQSGESDLHLIAKFNSEPFTIPIFWVWRISYWNGNTSWEFEAVHHKIFLTNKPTEIQEFSVSHGLNLITINRGWKYSEFIFRIGAGIAIAHPETTVRNKKLPEDGGIFHWGYYLSGPALLFSAGKNFSITDDLYVTCEVRINSTYAYIPIQNGNADLYNVSAQFIFGAGFNFLKL